MLATQDQYPIKMRFNSTYRSAGVGTHVWAIIGRQRVKLVPHTEQLRLTLPGGKNDLGHDHGHSGFPET